MNEAVLYALAGLEMSFAGFSGLVVTPPTRRKEEGWSPVQPRMLGPLIGDSIPALFMTLLPIPLALASWSLDAFRGFCCALLGT